MDLTSSPGPIGVSLYSKKQSEDFIQNVGQYLTKQH